jgi:hypothetical protein
MNTPIQMKFSPAQVADALELYVLRHFHCCGGTKATVERPIKIRRNRDDESLTRVEANVICDTTRGKRG